MDQTLLHRDGLETPEQMEARVRTVAAESLRQARVRFDLVAMLAFRVSELSLLLMFIYTQTLRHMEGDGAYGSIIRYHSQGDYRYPAPIVSIGYYWQEHA